MNREPKIFEFANGRYMFEPHMWPLVIKATKAVSDEDVKSAAVRGTIIIEGGECATALEWMQNMYGTFLQVERHSDGKIGSFRSHEFELVSYRSKENPNIIVGPGASSEK